MAINAKNIINKNGDLVRLSDHLPTEELQRNFVVEKKKVNGVASNEATLVVNGKQKHIGRKSHYLLDMLTLDDE